MIPTGEYEGWHLLQACCVRGCQLESPVLLMVLKGLKPESTNCTGSLSKKKVNAAVSGMQLF